MAKVNRNYMVKNMNKGNRSARHRDNKNDYSRKIKHKNTLR